MVRLRQRYMLCKLVHTSGDKFRLFGHTQSELEQTVRENIKTMYGAYGSAVCRDVTIKYFSGKTGMVIFRFAPKGQKMMGGAVANTTIGNFHLTILQVAGTGRTVTKKLIRHFKNDIVEATTLFTDRPDDNREDHTTEQLEKMESGEQALKY